MSEPTVSLAAGEVAALRARLVAMCAELIEWLVRDGTLIQHRRPRPENCPISHPVDTVSPSPFWRVRSSAWSR